LKERLLSSTALDERLLLSSGLHEHLLSYPEVEHITGLSRTTIWREVVKAKRFPAPVSISPNRVGFRASDIQNWIAARKPKHAA